jgi:hypothetical protein
MEILAYVANRSIDITALFQPGRFCTVKMRLVVVTLEAFWDKSVLLSNSYKRNDYVSQVCLAADGPLDVQPWKY